MVGADGLVAAPGQGLLGVVTRTDDAKTRALVERLNDAPTRSAVRAERALLESLGGGCQVPVGALGMPYEGGLPALGVGGEHRREPGGPR